MKYSDGAIDLTVNTDVHELVVAVKDRGPRYSRVLTGNTVRPLRER